MIKRIQVAEDPSVGRERSSERGKTRVYCVRDSKSGRTTPSTTRSASPPSLIAFFPRRD